MMNTGRRQHFWMYCIGIKLNHVSKRGPRCDNADKESRANNLCAIYISFLECPYQRSISEVDVSLADIGKLYRFTRDIVPAVRPVIGDHRTVLVSMVTRFPTGPVGVITTVTKMWPGKVTFTGSVIVTNPPVRVDGCHWNKIQRWVNSLWPGNAIWRHRSRATLAQVMLVAWRH